MTMLLALACGGEVEVCRWRGTIQDDPAPVMDRWEVLTAVWDGYTAADGAVEADHCESADAEDDRTRKPVVVMHDFHYRERRESLENNRHDAPRLLVRRVD